MIKALRGYLGDKYQSLVFRILLYFFIAALAVALVIAGNFTSRMKPRFENEILPNLSQYIQYLVADIGAPPDLNKAMLLAAQLPFELRIEGGDINWSSSPRLKSSWAYRLKPAPAPYNNYMIGDRRHDHLLLVNRDGYRYLFAVGSDLHDGSKHRHWVLFVLLGSILLLLYFSIRRLFNPLSDISAHLKRIGTGQLDESLAVKGKGEINQLVDGINQMTVDIKSILDSKAGLLLAISHELRSPLTRMRVNLELLENEKIQQTLIEDIGEIEALVAAILESERLNDRHAKLNRSYFDLADVTSDVIDQYFKDYEFDLSLTPCPVKMDELRMRLLIKNLIDNACLHTPVDGAVVEVQLNSYGQKLSLRIADHGSGIPATEIPKVTEPFYRTDSARGRNTGGYGLGLYLCRLIVEAHGGSLEIESTIGEGTAVTATFDNHSHNSPSTCQRDHKFRKLSSRVCEDSRQFGNENKSSLRLCRRLPHVCNRATKAWIKQISTQRLESLFITNYGNLKNPSSINWSKATSRLFSPRLSGRRVADSADIASCGDTIL